MRCVTFAAISLAALVLSSGASLAKYDPDPLPIVQVSATVAPVAIQEYDDILTTSLRAPVGHTHTCANGHTWDHSANPGHQCQACGLSQYVQDRTTQPVAVVHRQRVRIQSVQSTVPDPAPIVRYAAPVTVAASVQPVQAPASLPIQFLSLGSADGGCANGQCQTATTSKRRGILGLMRSR